MSQLALPAPQAARLTATSEAPDLMFVIRHYLWLIILGTLFGLAVGGGLYLTLRMLAPKYKAEVKFNVTAKNNSPLAEDRLGYSSDEVSSFIRTQVQLFTKPDFLDEVMKIGDIRSTTWFRTAKVPTANLKESIKIDPVQLTSLFTVSLTISQREEVDKILNLVCDAYIQYLEKEASKQRESDMRAFRDQVASAEKIRDRAARDAEDYIALHEINTMTQTYTAGLSVLGSLESELTKLMVDRATAQKAVDMVRSQQADPNYVLPPDYQEFVANQPVVRDLKNQVLALERQRDYAIEKFGPEHQTVRDIKIQINVANLQLTTQTKIEEGKAKARQFDSVNGALNALETRLADIKKKYDEKQLELRKLDGDLNKYRQLEDAQRVAREEYNRANSEYLRQDAIYRTMQSRVQLAQRAVAQSPDDIASPTMTAYLPAGAVLGLILSFAIAYLIELTNTRVRTPRDITRTMQLPLLGFVPDQNDDDMLHGDISTSIRTAPASMTAESFRQIRGRLTATVDNSALRTVLISSIAPGGGATTVASNMANGLALNGRRVLLVDANFYRPGLSAIYSNMLAVGFSDLLSNPTKIEAAVVQAPDLPNLYLMSAGTQPMGSGELLESTGLGEVLKKLRDQFDVVIFDGAPLSLVSDSVSLASKVDGVIAVVRAGRITRGTVARVRDQLKMVHANLLGVVLNAAQAQSAGYFKENYRTFYRYANGAAAGPAGFAGAARRSTPST